MRRHDDEKIAWLRRLPMFSGAALRDVRALAAAADVVTVGAGRVLHRSGHRPTEGFLITSGSVELVADGIGVATLGAGEVVGLHEVLDGRRSGADAVVADDLTALVLTAPRLRGLVQTNPALRAVIARQHVYAAAS